MASSRELGPLGSPPVGEFAREIERELGDILPSTVLGSSETSSLLPAVEEKLLSPAEAARLRGVAERYERYRVDGANDIRQHARELGIPDHQAAVALFARMEQQREHDALFMSREILVGLGSNCIEPVCSVNLNYQAYEGPLKVVRLEVPTDVAEHFMLTNLKLGCNSQFSSVGAAPMAVFATGSFRSVNLMLLDAWQVGMFLTLSVTNIDSQARNFSGVVVCWAWDDWQKWQKWQKSAMNSDLLSEWSDPYGDR